MKYDGLWTVQLGELWGWFSYDTATFAVCSQKFNHFQSGPVDDDSQEINSCSMWCLMIVMVCLLIQSQPDILISLI